MSIIQVVELKESRHDILRHFSFAMCKTTFNVRETTKYRFRKIEKHLHERNKPEGHKDGEGWCRLTRIATGQLPNCRRNISRSTSCDLAP